MSTDTPIEPLTKASLITAASELARRDADLSRVFKQFGPPPLWNRPATFATLARIVLEQQVSLAVAKITFDRLTTLCGGRITATTIADVSDEALRAAGLSRQKARYIRELGIAVVGRSFSIPALKNRSDDEVSRRIQALIGFGPWSAEVFLMMALLRPDILPVGDLGLIKGITEVCDETIQTPAQILGRAESWRPYRSVATRMIWQAYLFNRGKDIHSIAIG